MDVDGDGPILLRVLGLVDRPLELRRADLDAWPAAGRVLDVSRILPGRRGDAITLRSVLDRAGPSPAATHILLVAEDGYRVAVPFGPVRDQGLLVDRVGAGPLATRDGGPIRLMIRDPSVCGSGELDGCAHVKHLGRIEVAIMTRAARRT